MLLVLALPLLLLLLLVTLLHPVHLAAEPQLLPALLLELLLLLLSLSMHARLPKASTAWSAAVRVCHCVPRVAGSVVVAANHANDPGSGRFGQRLRPFAAVSKSLQWVSAVGLCSGVVIPSWPLLSSSNGHVVDGRYNLPYGVSQS